MRRALTGGIPRALTGGGSEGNERLTALTGAVLVVLLAAIGLTILRLRTTLLWVHLFVGMLLIGPVALKLASTGYRFVRYYTHDPVYRGKGPPAAYLRALGPVVVLTTFVVFASGVALLLAGPSARGALLPVHKVSFILWLGVTGLHVLGHLPEMAQAMGVRPLLGSPGGSGRALALVAALVVGLVLAVTLIPDFAPWLHYHRFAADR